MSCRCDTDPHLECPAHPAARSTGNVVEGERIEGWIDHDRGPDEGRWVAFWNLTERPLRKTRRATLILHPEASDG